MPRVLLGVDAGTSRIKTVAFTPAGAELASAARENEPTGPDGRMEQDMAATWTATAATIRDVVGELDAAATVAAVGVTGQGDGCWLVDADGEPARDAILWNDGRAAGILDEWVASGVADRVFDICGSALFPGASLPILRWLADEEPAALDRADTILYCKDWIKYRLTGELTTDLSDASLPFLDIEAREYTDELSGLVDLPGLESLYPRLDPPAAVIGRVTPAAADATGLPEGTPVVSGVIDIVASAYGSGVATPGEASSVVGTTALNQTLVESLPDDGSRAGFTLAVTDGRYARAMASMAGTPNADWALDHLATDDAFEGMEAAAAAVPPGADGVLYHPYLSASGERSPFLDPAARAGFTGLEPAHTRAHLLRAVYEGVALAVRDCYEHTPARPGTVTVSGGGARSELWCQLFADCLDAEIRVPAGTEFGARGAALLAAVGVDLQPDLETAVEAATSVERSYTPRPAVVDRYDRWYGVYRATREALADAWAEREAALAAMDDAGR